MVAFCLSFLNDEMETLTGVISENNLDTLKIFPTYNQAPLELIYQDLGKSEPGSKNCSATVFKLESGK